MEPESPVGPPLGEALPPLLRTEVLGRPLHAHERAGSTNALALALAAEGAAEGTLITAECQTAGRGRMGRSWSAAAGLNLLFSVVLRPTLPTARLGLLTLAGGVAVAEALDEAVAPLRPVIKWPNDVHLSNRKVCGMLLESVVAGAATAKAVVLGIGVNVNQRKFPPELAATATSLLRETGHAHDRAALLAAILARFEHHYRSLSIDDGAAMRQAYERRLKGIGQTVTFRMAGTDTEVTGTLVGIDAEGALRLRRPDGLATFYAGEITTNPKG